MTRTFHLPPSRFNARTPKIAMTLFGMSGGVSFFTLVAVLAFRLSRAGVPNTYIGIFTLSGLPYNVRFLWPFLIDHVCLPWISRRCGQRRGWGLTAQFLSTIGLCILGGTDPSKHMPITFCLVLLTAFFCAIQDIVSDAYRFDFAHNLPIAESVPLQTIGFRCGQGIAQAIVPTLAGLFGWGAAHGVVVVVKLLAFYALQRLDEPAALRPSSNHHRRRLQVYDRFSKLVEKTASKPFLAFFLISIILLRCLDTILGPIQTIFVGQLGTSNIEFGLMKNAVGFLSLLLGVLFAQRWMKQCSKHTSVLQLLSIGAIGQALSALLSLTLFHAPHYRLLLSGVTFIQDFFQGLMNTLLVIYISLFCEREIGIYHFTLFSTLSSLSRTAFTFLFSILIPHVGWRMLFCVPAVVCVPLLCILQFLVWRNMPLAPPPHSAPEEEHHV